jgi:hypothetical protein
MCARIVETNRLAGLQRVLPVGTTPQEAEAIPVKRMEVINKLNNSLLIQPAMTLEQSAKTLWVDYQKERATEESTVYSYQSMLTSLVFPSFGSLRLDRITPQHLTRLMKAAREKPYSSKYRLNLFSMETSSIRARHCDLERRINH